MDRPIIPIKTPAGQAEMSSRQRRISQRHRTMLLLVDGKRTEAQVRALSAQAGVPGICFDELMGLGLIVAPQPEPPGAARNGAASAAAAASAASAASSAPPIDGNSGFSPELAAVLDGFHRTSYGLIVKTVSVDGYQPPEPPNPNQPVVVASPAPLPQRGPRGGPSATAAAAAGKPREEAKTVLNEKLIKAVLLIELIKPSPPSK